MRFPVPGSSRSARRAPALPLALLVALAASRRVRAARAGLPDAAGDAPSAWATGDPAALRRRAPALHRASRPPRPPIPCHAPVQASSTRPIAPTTTEARRRPAPGRAARVPRRAARDAGRRAGGGRRLHRRAAGASRRPAGAVYGREQRVSSMFAEKPWAQRLARPAMKNVVRVDRELDDPLPPEAKDLDAVVIVSSTTTRLAGRRPRQDEPAPSSTRSSQAASTPSSTTARRRGRHRDVQDLPPHRRAGRPREVERAGFNRRDRRLPPQPGRHARLERLAARGGERRGTSDRFVLRFVKP